MNKLTCEDEFEIEAKADIDYMFDILLAMQYATEMAKNECGMVLTQETSFKLATAILRKRTMDVRTKIKQEEKTKRTRIHAKVIKQTKIHNGYED